ncbi:Gldg family protein [Mastigocoleus sp. MO_188.B34]|uniref:GldG family protein n=1 Tax=Mastigocoleus sp. MO_188.B34 TaxID=3036635 RepID=UPI002629CF07|nr:Gldg family protein [Mastigocoleus sp. MO_188.B34]MDJ0697757.1 Gldg family protein [Mastigocoleus sp. MO_188.B34]
MKSISKGKSLKYLFLFGPFFIAAGLAVGLVSETWNAIPLALISLGMAVIVGYLLWQSQQNKWWERRSTQAGTNAIIATLAVLTILGLVNFLGIRYQYRTDITESRLFSLAPQTQQLVKNLKAPIKVFIFTNNQNPQDQELLENYRRQSSNFDFEYINPLAKPGQAKSFGVKEEGEVYLVYGDKRQLVQVVGNNQPLSEVKLTNRLQQITSSTQLRIYFLQGHGEAQIVQGQNSMSQAFQAVRDTIFVPEALNLVESKTVPENTNVVVIAGPKQELFESEVKALQEYIDNGGNLLLMIDPDTDPKLNTLLSEWGVKLDDRLAVDISIAPEYGGPSAIYISEYGQHPITKDFGNGFSLYPLARPIEITQVDGIEVTELLKTKPYPNSWAESDLQSEDLKFNEGRDRKGPLILGAALKKTLTSSTDTSSTDTSSTDTNSTATNSSEAKPTPKENPNTTEKNSPQAKSNTTPSPSPNEVKTEDKSQEEKSQEEKPKESRLVVIGDSDFATNGLFGQQLNGDIFLNSVTWLSQVDDEQALSIRPKEQKNRRLNLTSTQSFIVSSTSVIVLPLLAFVTAGFLWWLRRR